MLEMVKTEFSNEQQHFFKNEKVSGQFCGSEKFQDLEVSVRDYRYKHCLLLMNLFRHSASIDDDFKNEDECGKEKRFLNRSEKDGADNRNESAHSSYANDSPILLSPGSESGMGCRDNNGGGSSGGGSVDDKRIRRQIANCNERRRMQSINAGFQALRQLLPRKDGEKISKAAILQQTADFIQNLQLKSQLDMMDKKNDRLILEDADQTVKKRRLEKSEATLEETYVIEAIANANNIGKTSTASTLDILECLKIIEELRNALTREKQLRMLYEKELLEIREKSFIEYKSLPQQQEQHNGLLQLNTNNILPHQQTIIRANNQIPASFLNEQNQHSNPANHRILFDNKHCQPTALFEVVSLENANTSNIIKLHQQQFQQQHQKHSENDIITNHLISLESNPQTIGNNNGLLTTQNLTTTSTPLILTNFGNTLNHSQQQYTLQNLQQPSKLFLQIDPTSPNFGTVTASLAQQQHQTTVVQPPQKAFQNLSVYCADGQTTSQQQQKQQQLTLQAKIEELRFLTNNCNVITTTTTQTTPNEINTSSLVNPLSNVQENSPPHSQQNLKPLNNSSGGSGQIEGQLGATTTQETGLSLSQRNLQAILEAICHLEGSHPATTAEAKKSTTVVANNASNNNRSPSSRSSNDLMVR